MPAPIYVIGHVNPDTDSIAAAMGYAWLLRERDGMDTIAARAGAINPQTSWILKFLNLEAPLLLADASPRFDSVVRRLDSTTPSRPLREAWTILSRTGGVAPIVNEDGTPFGLVTGRSMFEYVNRLVGPHPDKREAMRWDQILEAPCLEACDTHAAKVQANSRIRDVLSRLLREEGDEFWVLDEKGLYQGICRQRDLLNPPRLNLVLVDHNEAQQAVPSVEEAELLEILDHHRLGNPSTHTPIRFTVDIVGSTSTLVSEQAEEAGLRPPEMLAAMLLAGLMSDTLALSSPTTTERDRAAAERLSRWAFSPAGPLSKETIQTFGQKVLSASAGLGTRSPREIVASDMKIYRSEKYQFAISQVEVTNLYELNEHLIPLSQALMELRESKGLNFAMLLITDVVRGSSRLLVDNPPPILDNLPYPPHTDGTRLAEGVVSRKKQLLPVVLSLVES